MASAVASLCALCSFAEAGGFEFQVHWASPKVRVGFVGAEAWTPHQNDSFGPKYRHVPAGI